MNSPKTRSNLVGGAISVLAGLALSQPSASGSDLWWHLASGRYMFEQGRVPSTDVFSYTHPGALWMNHEWLWDLLYWQAYRLDPQVCAWLGLAVVCAVFAVVYSEALRESGSTIAAGLAVVSAAAVTHWFIDLRPHVFTLLFVATFVRTRHWRHVHWLWPPLVIVWTNLHAGFTFGIGMIGLWVGLETLRGSFESRRLRLERDLWIALGLCLLAVLVNPWGYRLLAYPLDYLDASSPFRMIIEWRPPAFGLDLHRYDGRFWWLVALWLASFGPAFRRTRYSLALSAVALGMAWTSRRFIPLFAITGAPVIALGIAAALHVPQARWPSLYSRRTAFAVWLVALWVTALLWRNVQLWPDLLYRWTQGSFYPAAATAYLNALEPPRRLFHLYGWGGYLMLHSPRIKVFFDGRANTIYGDQIALDYQTIISGAPAAEPLVRRYRFDMALIPPSSPLVERLGRMAQPWHRIYEDASAMILVPPGSPYLSTPRPPAQKIVSDRPAWLLTRARNQAQVGHLEHSRALVERAIEIQPLNATSYNALMGLAALEKDEAGIEAQLERGLAAIPRESAQLHKFAGYAYELAGDPARALTALRQGVQTGPFERPSRLRREIERLEARQPSSLSEPQDSSAPSGSGG